MNHNKNEHLINSHQQCKNNKTDNKNSSGNNTGSNSQIGNSTDTRLQEDRIVLGDYISNSKSLAKIPTSDAADDRANNELPSTSTADPVKLTPAGEFSPIEPEKLSIDRKELPEDV